MSVPCLCLSWDKSYWASHVLTVFIYISNYIHNLGPVCFTGEVIFHSFFQRTDVGLENREAKKISSITIASPCLVAMFAKVKSCIFL